MSVQVLAVVVSEILSVSVGERETDRRRYGAGGDHLEWWAPTASCWADIRAASLAACSRQSNY